MGIVRGVSRAATRRQTVSEGVVITKAVLRAAAKLGISNKTLARIIGLSEATVSRMGSGTYTLTPGDKASDLALLFVRFFRALDAIVGGDETVARAWVKNDNTALGAPPLTLIQSVPGLVHVVEYLDARRALA
jgi:antitoxin Xre/MbcA/ParS-like protein